VVIVAFNGGDQREKCGVINHLEWVRILKGVKGNEGLKLKGYPVLRLDRGAGGRPAPLVLGPLKRDTQNQKKKQERRRRGTDHK